MKPIGKKVSACLNYTSCEILISEWFRRSLYSFVNNSCTARRRIYVIPKEVSYAFGMMRINENKGSKVFFMIKGAWSHFGKTLFFRF